MEHTRLAEAACAFLDTLEDHARQHAHLPFDDRRRRDWHYVPRDRPGLSLGAMSTVQRKKAYRLLATALRPHAYAQAATIIGLEDVLDELEGGRGRRHGLDYDLLVFGDPSGAQPWGCRFEGHHLSVNLTVDDGQVAATPLFFGANPARIRHRGFDVSRPLPHEEELARQLVLELPDELRKEAVFSGEAPGDIVTRAAEAVSAGIEPLGVPRGALPAHAGALLDALLAVYLERARTGAPTVIDGDVSFAWAGSLEPGEPHYYRLQGGDLLVEYDNTQNGANHIHTVLRDPARDFDPLARHRALHHA